MSRRRLWETLVERFNPLQPVEVPAWRADRPLSPADAIVRALDRPFGIPRVLLTGTGGTGKTTELLRIAEARSRKEFVVFIDLERHFEEVVGDAAALQRISPWEVCFLAGIALLRSAEEELDFAFPEIHVRELEQAWIGLARSSGEVAREPEIDVAKLARSMVLLTSSAALAKQAWSATGSEIAGVAKRSAPPPWLRAFAGDPEVKRVRAEQLRAVGRALAGGAPVTTADLGDFAAACPAPASIRDALPADVEALGFAMEAMLRCEPTPLLWADLAAQAWAVGDHEPRFGWFREALREPLGSVLVDHRSLALRDPSKGAQRAALFANEAPRHRRRMRDRVARSVPTVIFMLVLFSPIVCQSIIHDGIRDSIRDLMFVALAVVTIFVADLIGEHLPDKSSDALANQRSQILDNTVHLVEKGDYAEAVTALEALSAAERHEPGYDPSLHRSATRLLAHALAEQGEDKRALAVLHEAIALEADVAGVEHDGFAALIPTLAEVFTRTGRSAEAEALLRKLLGPEATLPGDEGEIEPLPPATSPTRDEPADDEPVDGEEHLALFLAQPSTPPPSVEGQTTALRLLAEALLVQGRYEEAEALLGRALARLPMLRPEHPGQWRTLASLGRVLAVEGRTAEAREVLRRALAGAKRGVGEPHVDHARILDELSRIERLALRAPGAGVTQ